jgi:hypothetical protein
MTEKEELEVMAYKYAMNMQRLTGKHFHCHLAKAREVVRLIEEMKRGSASFTYLGQDGIMRNVKGTLTRYEKDFKRNYQANPDSRFVLYYDTTIGAWRTFQATGLAL